MTHDAWSADVHCRHCGRKVAEGSAHVDEDGNLWDAHWDCARRYGLSQGSVITILHSHGVEMRGQGLADNDIPTAAELYRSGTTLAQLGEHFGSSPNAIRRALVSAGVVMRARGGSKPRR